MKGLAILHLTLYMYNLMDIPCNIQCTNIKVVTNNSNVNTIRVHVYDDCVPSPYILSDYYNHVIVISLDFWKPILVGHVLYNVAVDNGVSYLWQFLLQ